MVSALEFFSKLGFEKKFARDLTSPFGLVVEQQAFLPSAGGHNHFFMDKASIRFVGPDLLVCKFSLL
jgi:hypothetical protein